MDDPDSVRLDRARVRTAFARAVGSYDERAVLQREIADRLLSRLDLVKLRPATVVDIGSGTGYCTRALARRYRRARVIGVDLALPMARAARTRNGWFSRCGYLCGDAERLPLASCSVDLVVSNLTLQWCDPDAVFGEIARVLRPGGLLMFTSFGPDTLRELRAAWRAVDDVAHVHDFTDMHDLGDVLVRNRFADPVMDAERITVTYADVLALLYDLKGIGAHNAARGRNHSLTGRRRFERFVAAYQQFAHADGRIPASYEAVYGHAWAPSAGSGARGSGAVVVPVTAIRRPPRSG